MRKYPTKKEILNKPVSFKKETITLLLEFKKKWKKKEKKKEDLLTFLVNDLSIIYKKPINITFIKNKPCQYNITEQTININKSLSIISTLHEFAHHLYGKSELKACRWSVWLFIKTFPKSYKKLKWKGHLLLIK